MAKAKDEGLCPLPESVLDPAGDLAFPVIPDATFALVRPEDTPPALAGKETTFEQANLVFDGSSGMLMATTIGMAVATDEGVRVDPLWSVSDDAMDLTMSFYPKDCFGSPISDDKYREFGLPPEPGAWTMTLWTRPLPKPRQAGPWSGT